MSNNSGGFKRKPFVIAEDGTYLVIIEASNGLTAITPYTLKLESMESVEKPSAKEGGE